MKYNLSRPLLVILMFIMHLTGYSQNETPFCESSKEYIDKKFKTLDHRLDKLEKVVEDILWYQKVGDIAFIEKVYITGPPSAKVKDSTARGALNPVKFWMYVFIPKWINKIKKYPLLVFPHGAWYMQISPHTIHI